MFYIRKNENTDAVETMVFFLDAAISEFVIELYQQSNDLDDKQTFLLCKEHIILLNSIEL